MPGVKKARTRKKSARRSTTHKVAKVGSASRNSTRAASAVAPKRRGRPPGSKNAAAKNKMATASVKKKRAPRGSLLKRLLEKERRIKQRWRVAAGNAKRAMLEMLKTHKMAEKRAATAARLAEAREQAVQKFAEQWDRKHLVKQAKELAGAAVPKRRRKRRAS